MRLQVVPVYVLPALLSTVLPWRSRREVTDAVDKPKREIIRELFLGGVRFLVLPVVLALARFLPAAITVFEIPEPSGRRRSE